MSDCIHCDGTAYECPGEQGLTTQENEVIALRNRVAELESELLSIENVCTADEGNPNVLLENIGRVVRTALPHRFGGTTP